MKLNVLGGLLVGVASNLIFLLTYWAGILRTEKGGYVLLLASAVHAIVLILVLSRHRSDALPNAVPFARLFGAGLMLSFVAGLFAAIGSYTFTTLIDPTYLGWIVERSIEYIKTLEMPEAQLQEEIAAMPSRVSAVSYAIQGLIGVCMTGFFLSLVISALLRLRAMKLVASEQTQRPSAPA